MEPVVYAFWSPKSGSTADEYEDAFAYSVAQRRFAIADGATESSFADRWARSLVQKYVTEPAMPGNGCLPLPEWLAPLQEEWNQAINWDALPWFAEEKARLGAFATFMGVSFAGPSLHDSAGAGFRRWFKKPRAERWTWRSWAIGDSCLFQVRDGKLMSSFPIERSNDFSSRPVLLSSNPEKNAPVWNAIRTAEGECRPGDSFFALTDALAKWFLSETENGRQPWSILSLVENDDAFKKLVDTLRADHSIRNDDTTMLSMKWTREPPRSIRTAHSKKHK